MFSSVEFTLTMYRPVFITALKESGTKAVGSATHPVAVAITPFWIIVL